MPWFVIYPSENVLVHHGIKGQKWGVRRYQNKDGSLTQEGKARYKVGESGALIEMLATMAVLTAAENASKTAIQIGLDSKNSKVDPKSIKRKQTDPKIT